MEKTKIDQARTFLTRPRTAAELATHLGVSNPTAYTVLKAVKAKRVGEIRQGTKGPLAGRFQI